MDVMSPFALGISFNEPRIGRRNIGPPEVIVASSFQQRDDFSLGLFQAANLDQHINYWLGRQSRYRGAAEVFNSSDDLSGEPTSKKLSLIPEHPRPLSAILNNEDFLADRFLDSLF